MPRKLPPLSCLSAFEAVARLGSFARAAHELCVTRSAISHRIKALEEYFGVQLIARRHGTLRLAAEGTCLLEAVTNSLSNLEQACERLAGTARRPIRVSVGLAFASTWLMKRLGGFHRLQRDIDLEISALRLLQPDKLACLQSGEADVVISYGAAKDWEGYEYREIIKCRMFPVCSPGYYESVGGLNSPQALLNATLLRLPRQPWRPWFRVAGLVCQEPYRGPVFSHAGLMVDAAINGQGVALVRDVLVEEELKAGRLFHLFDVSVESAYYAVYLPEAAARPEVSAFLDWLVHAAASEPATGLESSPQSAIQRSAGVSARTYTAGGRRRC